MASLTCPGSEAKLLHPVAIDYWTEHSDRAGLDSWLGSLMVGSDFRKFVGRWAAQGSEDSYVRSATKIVENCQRMAASHVKAQYRGGPDFVGEEFALEQLSNYMLAMGASDADVAEQLSKLTTADFSLPADPCARLSENGAFSALTAAQPSAGSEWVPSVALMDLGVDEQEAEPEEEDLEPDEGVEDVAALAALVVPDGRAAPVGYVISKTQGGRCLRLHHTGFCFRVPGEHYREFVDCGVEAPAEHLFTHRCKDCFPSGRPEEAEAEASASDGNSVSSSSAAGSQESS